MNQKLKIFSALILASLLFIGCEEDSDPTTEDYQQQYLGTWDCNEKTGANAPQFYEVLITAGPTENSLVITNLYQNGTVYTADINGGFALDIPDQSSQGITLSGTGSTNADFQQISLNFTANDGSALNDNVEAILIK